MCILKAFSSARSFKSLVGKTSLPIYSSVDKGEIKNKELGTTYGEYRISFDVSDREWDDFPGQVDDAAAFLTRWESDLKKFIREFEPDELLLDFAIYSRLNEEIVNQNDYIPARLVRRAGDLGIGIGMSIYSKEAFEKN